MYKKILLIFILISSCASAQEVNIEFAKKIDSLKKEGAIFYASGNEPSSVLCIYSADGIKIKINEDDYIFGDYHSEFDSANATMTYEASDDKNYLTLKIKREKCFDDAGNEYKYSAGLFLNGDTNKLCGRYLNFLSNPFLPHSSYGLYNIWNVKTFNGESIPVQSLIEINLNDETVFGYNSMLEISADTKISGDKISFYNLKYLSGEKSYFDEIKGIDGIEFSYQLKGINLILNIDNHIILGLNKVD